MPTKNTLMRSRQTEQKLRTPERIHMPLASLEHVDKRRIGLSDSQLVVVGNLSQHWEFISHQIYSGDTVTIIDNCL